MKNLLIVFALLLPSLSWGDGNIDTQLQMIEKQRNRTQNNMNYVGETLGGILGRQELRKAELAAVEFFKDDVTMEKVIIFNKLYPIMSIPSIIELAKAVDEVRRLNAPPKKMTQEETDKMYKEMSELVNELWVKPTVGMSDQEREEFLEREQRRFNRFVDDYYGIRR